jgi:hypothetical protein
VEIIYASKGKKRVKAIISGIVTIIENVKPLSFVITFSFGVIENQVNIISEILNNGNQKSKFLISKGGCNQKTPKIQAISIIQIFHL